MTKPLLATIEALLTLVASGLAALLLVIVCLAGWFAVQNRPMSDISSVQKALLEGDESGLVDPSGSLALLIVSFSAQSLVFATVGVVMARWRVERTDPSRRWGLRATLGYAVLGGLVAVAGTMLISGVMTLLGFEVEEQPWVLTLVQTYPGALWMLGPWTVVVGPVAEELFFRFYMFRFLCQRVGVGFGYVVSSLAFAVVHFHPPALPLYLFYGLLLAWAYRRTSRFAAPVLVHMLINLVSTVSLVVAAGEMGGG